MSRAGDSAKAESDFLAVINRDPTSPQYGAVVTTLPTGELGANPHHTEAATPANGHRAKTRVGRTVQRVGCSGVRWVTMSKSTFSGCGSPSGTIN
ncbi:hypothetical protein [Gemmatimonas sp.]|uniref:hypothetical protein n=1 Tax=Gemmatimonas sp. TaxID=1962908 RepID=UPI00333E6850